MNSITDIQSLALLLPKDFDSIIEEPVTSIRDEGFSNLCILIYRNLIRHFLYWLVQIGCVIAKIAATVIERFIQYECDCRDERSKLLVHPRRRYKSSDSSAIWNVQGEFGATGFWNKTSGLSMNLFCCYICCLVSGTMAIDRVGIHHIAME